MPGVPGYPDPISQSGSINPTPQNLYNWGNLNTAWRQFIGKSGGTEEYSFGPNMSRAAFIIDVPWDNFEQSVAAITGYPKTAGGGGITRNLPVNHPNFYWMWAKSIPKVSTGAPRTVGGPKGPAGMSRYMNYTHARLTIEFWTPSYAIVADGNTPGEWARYTDWEIEPAGEFLSRPQGTYKWTEGGPQINMPFNGQKNIYLPKKRLKVIWNQVPEGGLFADLHPATPSFASPNLDDAVGKVNDAAWAGYTAGTILCEAWGCTPELLPVNPSLLSIDTGWNISRVWNVFISLLQFDPPAGGATHGHNTMPQNDGLWYALQAVGGANLPYKPYDMNKIWKMN